MQISTPPLIIITAFLATIVTHENSYADIIHLKNGDIISGKLVSLSDGLCTYKTKYGAVISFKNNEIEELSTDHEYEISLVSSEVIKGKLTLDASNNTILESKTFGKSVFNPENISSMKKIFPSEKKPSDPSTNNQSFGEKEKNPPLDFLTGSTVLLAHGSYELEIGLVYKQSRRETSLMQVGYFQKSAFTARKLEASLTGRAGFYDTIESWVNIPYSYTYIQDVSTNDYVRDKDAYAFGDLSFGVQYLLFEETESIPSISFSLSGNIPTGEKNYRAAQAVWQDPLDSGSGHWAASTGLSFVRTTDPAIIFGGISYQYAFSNDIDNYTIEPGSSFAGYLGLGFALNEKLSIGSRFGYGYNSTITADGNEISGSDSEPMDLSFSASYRLNENWVTTPQFTFGLNDDAGTAAASLRFTRGF